MIFPQEFLECAGFPRLNTMKSQTKLTLDLLKLGADPAQILVKLALRKALMGCTSVLDVGCGFSPLLRQLGVSHAAGIEGYQPAFEKAQQLKTHDEIVLGDVRELSRHFKEGQFDACIAMDVIEHLPKEDGLRLMRDMERIAKKRVIFFTPNGFLPQRHSVNSDLQAHLSGWEAGEVKGYGYEVAGMLGPKKLRGEYHALLRRPAAFWGMVSFLSQIFQIRHHPEKAAAILCVKKINDVRR